MWLWFFWKCVEVHRFRVIVHHPGNISVFKFNLISPLHPRIFPGPLMCVCFCKHHLCHSDYMWLWPFCELISASLWALLLASTKRWCFQNKLFRAVIGIQSRKGVEDAHSGQWDQHVEGGSAPYSGDYPLCFHIFYLLLFMGLTSCVSAPLGVDCSLTCRQ